MRVGVHAGDFAPTVGGGYTFAAQVMDAFLNLAGTSKHRFVVFSTTELQKHFQSAKHENVEYCVVQGKNGIDTYLNALKRYSPLFAYLYRRPGQVERLAIRSGVQCIWHVGGGAYDPLDIPYIATVWDIQHRTHPWFPEVSASGRWDYRELTHSVFLKRATFVITGTRTGAEQLGWYYQIPPDRIRLLPHPTPLLTGSAVAPPANCGMQPGARPFVFYPAQFWAHKNHANLLHALAILRDKFGHDIDLALTGSDQGNLEHIQMLAAHLGLSSQVFFLGFVTTAELLYLYRNAAALTYISFSGPENLPPLEAFSLGCPVIVSDYPGAREQIGEAGIFVNPGNPEEIAAAIKLLLERGDLRGKLIELGVKRAAERNADNYVQGVFSILDEFEATRRCWK